MTRRRGLAGLVLSLGLMVGVDATAAESGTPRPDWCRPGWQCLPTQELADTTIELLQLREAARRKVMFHQLGVEYIPGDQHATPYGLMGLRVGPISAWGGFFGDQPAVGVGYSW